ncbi:acylamino-acid-releasing enzyme-like isoform X2 [Ipomoea triloba]|uniref:acylamino-acid-releasing enzyme-like isoform X2 n=1 Tax=Ipomoea triloba TaxID=35885 RepID=UPI00125E0442|nr:acylamino-acid-releasing enzyme-like isoform X2 [Ipomoea triloba]
MGLDASAEEECSYQSRLLQDFMNIPSIDKAWTFTSNGGSQVMFSLTQPNLQANKKRKYVLSSQISRSHSDTIEFQWAAFPIEMGGTSIIAPSPSGSKLLVVHNSQIGSPTRFEIWGQCGVEKEFHIPASIHGYVFSDGWFEGISWNYDETLIAYVAEEPLPAKPTFTRSGFKKGNSMQDDCGSWKGQGDWDEGWGEAYAGKRQPELFVINIDSGEVRGVEKTDKSLSVGQVVWAPLTADSQQYLVFVGWPSARKFGIKYCTNRRCALYAIEAPFVKLEAQQSGTNANTSSMVKLTDTISSAMFPRFSPDGKFLVFLSSKSAVDSGAHCATDSLHRIAWPVDGKPCPPAEIIDVVPVVMHAHEDSFPGLYCSNPGLYHSNILSQPWLSDGHIILLTSVWGSSQAILSIDIISGEVLRISPSNSSFSWEILALDGDNIIAVCSSPVNIPEIKYGCLVRQNTNETSWNWLDTASPIFRSSAKFSILKIPVSDTSENSTEGANEPYEAIFVSSKLKKRSGCDPLVAILHGGPHAVSLTSFCNTSAFLCSLGFNLLMVNYRGSLGFGEEALQSLPGKVGSQDVKDVLHAIDYVIDMGFADSSKISVTGISHGGFLTTHLIGQAPEKFAAAAALNPVCNFALMVGTTDIPDWCYFEALGSEGKLSFTEAPKAQHLEQFYNKSPISHVSKVKAPTLVLLGSKDLRVPIPDGLQYARALKEKGVEVKVVMFPDDIHPIDKPQSEYESFLNIGVWFKKYCC